MRRRALVPMRQPPQVMAGIGRVGTMRAMLAAAIATGLVAPGGAARAEVRVTFTDPRSFTDAWL